MKRIGGDTINLPIGRFFSSFQERPRVLLPEFLAEAVRKLDKPAKQAGKSKTKPRTASA